MKVKVKTRLNLRKQPNRESDVIRILEVDEVIDYTSEKDGLPTRKNYGASRIT